ALEQFEGVAPEWRERLDVQCADRLVVTGDRYTDLTDDARDRLEVVRVLADVLGHYCLAGRPDLAGDARRTTHAIEHLPEAALCDAAELPLEFEVEARHELPAARKKLDDRQARALRVWGTLESTKQACLLPLS